ncbi:J domain-containing protein [Vibrio vulnificus]|uniref:J domain-containing protein n=1 Tax=Vibrio vulnificus TaxID=672 RepID=UPI004058C538
MTKQSVKNALLALGLSSSTYTSSQIKKAYKIAVINCHHDKMENAAAASMVKINDAYAFLTKSGFVTSDYDIDSIQTDEIFNHHQGHSLCGTGLPSLSTVQEMLSEMYNFEFANKVLFEQDSRKAYFQEETSDFCFSQYTDCVVVSDITNAGKRGKTITRVTIKVDMWGDVPLNQQNIRNPLRKLFEHTTPEAFSWSMAINDLAKELIKNQVEISPIQSESTYHSYRATKELHKHSSGTFHIMIDGTRVDVFVNEYSSHGVFSPFNLAKRFKPLTELPKKWTRAHLIRILVNGQFKECKRKYSYTDDFAFDAANSFFSGYMDNPLKHAIDWIESACSSELIYTNETDSGIEVNFGLHMNENSRLIVDLDNRYSLTGLKQDVVMLNQIK